MHVFWQIYKYLKNSVWKHKTDKSLLTRLRCQQFTKTDISSATFNHALWTQTLSAMGFHHDIYFLIYIWALLIAKTKTRKGDMDCMQWFVFQEIMLGQDCSSWYFAAASALVAHGKQIKLTLTSSVFSNCVQTSVASLAVFPRIWACFLWSCGYFWRLADCLFLGLF